MCGILRTTSRTGPNREAGMHPVGYHLAQARWLRPRHRALRNWAQIKDWATGIADALLS